MIEARGIGNYRAMKTKTMIYWYVGAVVIIAAAGIAISVSAYIHPCFAAKIGRVPTWVGAFFGALFAVTGAFIFAAWKHDKEKQELRENLSRIIGFEISYQVNKILAGYAEYRKCVDESPKPKSSEKEINHLEKKIREINSEIASRYLNRIIHISDHTFTKDISIYNSSTLFKCTEVFSRQKSVNDLSNLFGKYNYREDIETFDNICTPEIIIYVAMSFDLVNHLREYCPDLKDFPDEFRSKYPDTLAEISSRLIADPALEHHALAIAVST